MNNKMYSHEEMIRLCLEAKADEWVSMIHAPKDGTRVLLLCADGEWDSGYWHLPSPGSDVGYSGEWSTEMGYGKPIAWRPYPQKDDIILQLIDALRPFANYACNERHVGELPCHNCIARDVIARAAGTGKEGAR